MNGTPIADATQDPTNFQLDFQVFSSWFQCILLWSVYKRPLLLEYKYMHEETDERVVWPAYSILKYVKNIEDWKLVETLAIQPIFLMKIRLLSKWNIFIELKIFLIENICTNELNSGFFKTNIIKNCRVFCTKKWARFEKTHPILSPCCVLCTLVSSYLAFMGFCSSHRFEIIDSCGQPAPVSKQQIRDMLCPWNFDLSLLAALLRRLSRSSKHM